MSEQPYTLLNGRLRFSGDCELSRPFCGAVCCKNIIVFLTKEEELEGKYDCTGPTEGCKCRTCEQMRVNGRKVLRRNTGGCVYLDGTGKCSVYDTRPSQCREFECREQWWALLLMTGGGEK